MRYACASNIGRVRRTNEDSTCILPEIGFFAVADGMGGHRAGDVASKAAVRKMEELFRSVSSGDEPMQFLTKSVQSINKEIFNLAKMNAKFQGMGTTFTAVLIKELKMFTVHVGDSRVYMVRQHGIIQLTEDHTVVNEMVKKGNISDRQAREHPYRNVLTRALGTMPEVTVDVGQISLQAGDRVLLCTDGLTEFIEDVEICSLVERVEIPDAAVDRLINTALARGGSDNVTVILITI